MSVKIDENLFDLNKPVKLIRPFVSRRRNKYSPTVYRPNELPLEAYTTYYCEPNKSKDIEEDKPQPSVNKEKEAVTRKKNGDVVISPNQNDSYNTRVIEPQSGVEPVKHNLNINYASAQELESLVGVGPGIASKVIEYREQSPFIDYTDLNGRISLPFGAKWENYDLVFKTKE